jgi:hypothetical protein
MWARSRGSIAHRVSRAMWATISSGVLVMGCRNTDLPTPPITAVPDVRLRPLGPRLSDRIAYVFADQPAASPWISYAPKAEFSLNGKSLPNRIMRTGAGIYSVKLAGMAKAGDSTRKETILVTAVAAGVVRCYVQFWVDSGPDLEVVVKCANLTGTLTDAAFTLLMVGRGSLQGNHAFGWVSPFGRTSDPYSFTTHGGPIGVAVAPSAGAHVVILGISYPLPTAGPPQIVLASNYGSFDTACGVYWDPSDATVYCNRVTGEEAVSSFDILQLENGRPGRRIGFVEGSALGTRSTRTFNSSGGAVTITRVSPGAFDVRFAGLAVGRVRETVQVSRSSHHQPFGWCYTPAWRVVGSDMVVSVVCRDRFGAAIDNGFSVLILE